MSTIDLTHHGLLALTRSSLASLRAALVRDAGPAAATYLQEAGYAGGEAVYASFCAWMQERGMDAPEELELEAFEHWASEYFRDAGWGSLSISSLHDAVATLDSADWGEADPASGVDHPTCHLTTGMFADFFGRVADRAVAVLEVECRSTGAPRCRFLVGSADVMSAVYERMGEGSGYDEALAEV